MSRRRAVLRDALSSVVLAASFLAALRMAVRGSVPQLAAGILATSLLVLLVAATFQLLVDLGPCRTDERGEPRPLLRRHGFWVVVLGSALSLPMLGAFGLIDPWETHYAEVAREMIERRDFVSPWWANEGWFFSKPILVFWLEAASMVVLGVGTGPNAPLAGGAHPEWAVRLPTFAFALLGSYALYHGVSRTVGRRAGFVGAVVLWSAPGFALLSRQAITDMPLVAGTAAALGLFARALTIPDDEETRAGWPGRLLGAFLLLCVVAQVALVVFSRSGFGSPHACGLPGHPACAPMQVAYPRITAPLQGAAWLTLGLGLAFGIAEERRVARLYAVGGWACVALAAMAKGPAGIVVPIAALGLVVVATRRLPTLLRMSPLTGALVVVSLVAPWYLAAYARHGRPFVDELVLRHMFGRALEHLHDTNAGEDVGIGYYVRQLAYATFPWSGIVVAAAVATATRADDPSRRQLVRLLLTSAALAAFTLVSMMQTKFHHYALLAVPPLAMVTGIFVEERFSRRCARRPSDVALLVASAAIAGLVARDVASTPQRFVQLFTYRYDRAWPSAVDARPVLASAALLTVLLLAVALVPRARMHALAGLAVASIGLSAFLLDRYLPPCADDGGQRRVIAAYYADADARARARAGAGGQGSAGPIVAYRLNWKGENFYTGNDVAIFVSAGAPMKAYLATRADRTVYFLTERARIGMLRSELGAVHSFAELTGASTSHEFALVRVEL